MPPIFLHNFVQLSVGVLEMIKKLEIIICHKNDLDKNV